MSGKGSVADGTTSKVWLVTGPPGVWGVRLRKRHSVRATRLLQPLALGIKVTIVEPGGFRTDFAGASTSIYEGRPEYDSTVGKTARFQRDFNGKQPGDPAKAADVLVHIAGLENPPLRLLLGSDAFHAAEQNDIAKMKLDQDLRDLTFSIDFSEA